MIHASKGRVHVRPPLSAVRHWTPQAPSPHMVPEMVERGNTTARDWLGQTYLQTGFSWVLVQSSRTLSYKESSTAT